MMLKIIAELTSPGGSARRGCQKEALSGFGFTGRSGFGRDFFSLASIVVDRWRRANCYLVGSSACIGLC